jgi:hypothetical protein
MIPKWLFRAILMEISIFFKFFLWVAWGYVI